MRKAVLIDTNVMVDFLRGNPKAVTLLKRCSSCVVISSIVAAELYAGVKGEKELEILDSLLSLFRLVPVSSALARSGGLLKRDYGKTHGVGLADAIVAATAIAEHADLKTLNVKHYPMLKGLKPPYTKR